MTRRGQHFPLVKPYFPPSFFTWMDPLTTEASYWVVLFISPRITVSREPDSAPFRAEIMS